MGKSDQFVFQAYFNMLQKHNLQNVNSVAFLGYREENFFTKTIKAPIRKFFDRELGNWEINSNWSLGQNFDLIVCTRCSYFSNAPNVFIAQIKANLTKDGYALVDWGLGDHWRFKKFKVGWIRHGEHEFAYDTNNKLWSTFWNENLQLIDDVKRFWNNCLRLGHYKKDQILNDVIKAEVPYITSYTTVDFKSLCLWDDSPQLYLITLIKN